jgi:hypothetical protein
MVRRPTGHINGISLAGYREDRVYDVSAELGEYLVINDLAVVEMRRLDEGGLRYDRRRTRRVGY